MKIRAFFSDNWPFKTKRMIKIPKGYFFVKVNGNRSMLDNDTYVRLTANMYNGEYRYYFSKNVRK